MSTNTIIILSLCYVIIGIMSLLLLNLYDYILERDWENVSPPPFPKNFWKGYCENIHYWWTTEWSAMKVIFVIVSILFWPIIVGYILKLVVNDFSMMKTANKTKL